MNDILIDLGVAALLRVLKSKRESGKWRAALLKIFKAIAFQFNADGEFQTAAVENLAGVKLK